jgi:hypothetical protein
LEEEVGTNKRRNTAEGPKEVGGSVGGYQVPAGREGKLYGKRQTTDRLLSCGRHHHFLVQKKCTREIQKMGHTRLFVSIHTVNKSFAPACF